MQHPLAIEKQYLLDKYNAYLAAEKELWEQGSAFADITHFQKVAHAKAEWQKAYNEFYQNFEQLKASIRSTALRFQSDIKAINGEEIILDRIEDAINRMDWFACYHELIGLAEYKIALINQNKQ